MKALKIFFCLLFLFSLDQAMAAVSIRLSSSAFLMITPGIDVLRQNIATITISADQPYEVTLNDDNGGAMVNGFRSIPYRLSYNNGAEVNVTRTPLVVEQGASLTSADRIIAVTILGVDTAIAAAGDYTTTLTVTITGY